MALDREQLEKVLGPIPDFQWRCMEMLMKGDGAPSQFNPRWQGKKWALDQLVDYYRKTGHRMEKHGTGYLIYEKEGCDCGCTTDCRRSSSGNA